MAAFGIEIERGGASEFIKTAHERLQVKNLVENPFTGSVRDLETKGMEQYYLIYMTPVYPKIYKLGLLLLMGGFFIGGFGLWLLPGFILSLPGLLWTKYFFYLMFRIGLKRSGYKGKCRLLRSDELMLKCAERLNSV